VDQGANRLVCIGTISDEFAHLYLQKILGRKWLTCAMRYFEGPPMMSIMIEDNLGLSDESTGKPGERFEKIHDATQRFLITRPGAVK